MQIAAITQRPEQSYKSVTVGGRIVNIRWCYMFRLPYFYLHKIAVELEANVD